MTSAVAEVSLAGPLSGVGVDVVSIGRVSARLARAKFSAEEVERFRGRRELPFAAREAVLKAVGGPGILRAPLRDMVVEWSAGALRLRPGPAYREVMRREGVASVRLAVLAVSPAHVVVTALAARDGPPSRVRVAYATEPVPSAADDLDDDERAACLSRPDPRASAAARMAAHAAGRLLFAGATLRVRAPRDRAPEALGAPTPTWLSLAHERDLAIALLAHPTPGDRDPA
ncbi:MAG: 4'-phosphopantetheinyl transferase superfamily protein [Polyangiaceae bacterium]|nr:4'-phosphopantetheinyl transferase superfamily protein [Polyangiaceae bacterium]